VGSSFLGVFFFFFEQEQFDNLYLYYRGKKLQGTH